MWKWFHMEKGGGMRNTKERLSKVEGVGAWNHSKLGGLIHKWETLV
jgi:hypothetical protein